MEIKKNKTRISLWLNNSRFSKIEVNKYFVTDGFSNKIKKCGNYMNLIILMIAYNYYNMNY